MNKTEMLAYLAEQASKCQKCKVLSSSRKKTVFGRGNPEALIAIVGEAPGANEDEQGLPFVGKAGTLLDNILSACKIPQEEVYICNVIKCRPPNNRLPDAGEIYRCSQFLELQLRIIDPMFIICLGSVASKRLFGFPVSQMRGCVRPFTEWGLKAQALCTFHPSYLLRTPEAKKDVWEDMQMLLQAMRETAKG